MFHGLSLSNLGPETLSAQRGELGRVNQHGEFVGGLVEAGRLTRCTDRGQQRKEGCLQAGQFHHRHRRGELNLNFAVETATKGHKRRKNLEAWACWPCSLPLTQQMNNSTHSVLWQGLCFVPLVLLCGHSNRGFWVK